MGGINPKLSNRHNPRSKRVLGKTNLEIFSPTYLMKKQTVNTGMIRFNHSNLPQQIKSTVNRESFYLEILRFDSKADPLEKIEHG